MKHLLALLVLALTSPAFAAESNGSQYQWQTPAGKWEVTPELSYGSSKTAFKPSGDDTSTGLQESVLGEYGINEMFSAGLKLTASSVTTTHTAPAKDTTQSGLHDLIAFFHGRSPIGEASLRYGVDVNFGLDKQELDATNTYVTNNSSGGMGAKPWVGYEMGKDNCLMGAQLSYKMYMGDRTLKPAAPAAEVKLSGSQEIGLNFFYEHNMTPWTLGAALEVNSSAKTERKQNGVDVGTVAGMTTMGLKLYTPYVITETITLLPSFTYTKATAYDDAPAATGGSGIDSVTGWTLAVGGRFQF